MTRRTLRTMNVLFYSLLGTLLILRFLLCLPGKLWAGIRYFWRLRQCFQDVVRCQAGHGNRTYGFWQCALCGARYHGWVFGRCPVCRTSCGYFSCEECGAYIKSPWRFT